VSMPNKHKTGAIQKSIETGDRFPLSFFDSRTYIQHNLALGDGFGALLEFLDSLPPGSSRVHPVRLFEDGDITFAHLGYFLAPMGEVTGFEVHRWHDGHIVEHWDNLQPTAARPNDSGRTMLDGPAEIDPGASTDATKDLCRAFVQRVLIDGPHDDFDAYVAADCHQHNPTYGDGADLMKANLASNPTVRYSTVHHVFGDHDFCLTVCEGTVSDQPTAFYDLFRVADGVIVEHWDVLEPIPPRADWKNDNGKF
jgi:predicted SnoaL-like aldol condensation-catalyzing enzyme